MGPNVLAMHGWKSQPKQLDYFLGDPVKILPTFHFILIAVD